VPDKLSERLHEGALDVAVMAQAGPFDARFDIHKLYREHFVIAFPPGHRFEAHNAISFREVHGEAYLRRINCEYFDHLDAIAAKLGISVRFAYKSEREDWIQTMVMAGMGICFTPEHSLVLPGLQARRVIDPEVYREVALVTVAGRRFSPAVAAFVRAIKAYRWPGSEGDEAA
jgi:DNA-binding transcriptional LysR family regulator